MVKPKKCRIVSSLPNVTYFKPAGIPCRILTEVRLSVEEAESLRLTDIEELEQIDGAIRMGVSRPTFQRVLYSARKKVADALLNGKALRIEGGSYQVNGIPTSSSCHRGHTWTQPLNSTDKDQPKCPFCTKGSMNKPLPIEAKDSLEKKGP